MPATTISKATTHPETPPTRIPQKTANTRLCHRKIYNQAFKWKPQKPLKQGARASGASQSAGTTASYLMKHLDERSMKIK